MLHGAVLRRRQQLGKRSTVQPAVPNCVNPLEHAVYCRIDQGRFGGEGRVEEEESSSGAASSWGCRCCWRASSGCIATVQLLVGGRVVVVGIVMGDEAGQGFLKFSIQSGPRAQLLRVHVAPQSRDEFDAWSRALCWRGQASQRYGGISGASARRSSHSGTFSLLERRMSRSSRWSSIARGSAEVMPAVASEGSILPSSC